MALPTNTVVLEPEISSPLIPKPAIGHDPEPVPSTSESICLRYSHLKFCLLNGCFPRCFSLKFWENFLSQPS